MVLLTTFHTSTGTLELRDALVLGDTKDPRALGEHAPPLLARIQQLAVHVELRLVPGVVAHAHRGAAPASP